MVNIKPIPSKIISTDITSAMASPTFDLIGGYKIPAVGLGTFTLVNGNEVEATLDTAFEAGYRHLDTANLYNNEHLIGDVLKKWFDSGKLRREDLFITTKLPPHGIHPDRLDAFVQESLKKLQVDYIDLYLIHFPICTNVGLGAKGFAPEPTDHVAVWKKLEGYVDSGRIRSLGVSNFNETQIRKIIDNTRIKPAANEVELHVYLQQPDLVKFCQDNGIVVISYFSLGNLGFNTFLEKAGLSARIKVINQLQDPTVNAIAKKLNKTAGQILLKYLVQKKIAVIPKSSNPNRIKENISLFDFDLDKNDLKALEELDRGEEGRQSTFLEFIDHPEYPFLKLDS